MVAALILTKMANPKKDLTNENEATLHEMFDYFCSKINLGQSFLDAKSIACMNRLFIELKKDDKKIEI